jgi:hypothetical protein
MAMVGNVTIITIKFTVEPIQFLLANGTEVPSLKGAFGQMHL